MLKHTHWFEVTNPIIDRSLIVLNAPKLLSADHVLQSQGLENIEDFAIKNIF